MSRSAEEVLNDHLRVRAEGDLETDLRENYDPDVIVLTPDGCYRGHDGVRESAGLLYEAIRDSDDYRYTAVTVDDRMAMLEWSAPGDEMDIADGVDSYLIEDGLIRAQTIRYTVTVRRLSQAKSV